MLMREGYCGANEPGSPVSCRLVTTSHRGGGGGTHTHKCAPSSRHPPAPSPRFQDVKVPGPGCRDIKVCPPQPACQSAYAGDVRGLFAVLSEDPSRLNGQDIISGDTPLIAGCRRGNLKVVQYLLDQGADVHITNKVRQSDR